ncbi:mechanosensitive ion channel family protein [Microbulbifer flavimaris]|uniref:Small-conductance mechanosensitive channel n=1 Tax=Microbulbifer flavimaris TaxID=1781068 RepID=A0ABX4I229_9GAMM|nr:MULTISPECIES: mechanosensitive ion channel family protein [Microbulbifer]KUJ84388.1 mechanosensitive ion channel protein MscS [Microbulbifer sp. ZGT114]PCO06472.1 mechanosensitive ion channel family protein [Microbulbifer flavimaris]
MAQQESSEAIKELPEQVDRGVDTALDKVDGWIADAIQHTPNFIAALLVMLMLYLIGMLFGYLTCRHFSRRERANLGEVLGGLVKWIFAGIGFLLAATIVMPTLKPGDLVAGLGVGSVAFGFAFKDILQNWLAGLLILIKHPFRVNDQIRVGEFEGTVKKIENRATLIRTFDGQRVVIPNSDIYTNAVIVKTAHPLRRSEYDVGIGYGDGLDRACEVLEKAVSKVEGVQKRPAVEALPWELAASWVTIRVRWWTHSRQTDTNHIGADVIRAIKLALDEARIDMPYETRVQLFHDQTEETDGDRSRQREGWPAPADGSTRPRWQAQFGEKQP